MTESATSELSSIIDNLDPSQAILVGGKWQSAAAGTFAVEDPATTKHLADVSDGGAAEATAAVDSAAAALAEWSATPPRKRSELLSAVYRGMVDQADNLAALIAAENGKSLKDAQAEVTYAAEFFRWFAEEAVRPGGDFGVSPAGGTRTIVTHKPVGVAALVTPWNFPAAMATRKIAPALAAGCTVVLKPASETPLTSLAVARIANEVGIPDGVINVVPGSDAGAIVTTWLEDERVRKISFTGSTNIGRLLLKQAAERVVNTSMELGGNGPFVVTANADIDAAVEGAMIAKFRNGGQACTAANRLYVHADVAEEFTAKLGAKVEALTVGPAADGHDIGPLISAKALKNVSAMVDDAVAGGAKITHQAKNSDATGHFLAPVVLTDVPPTAGVVCDEIFGPVAPIVTWTDLDAVLEEVNGTEFGLAAYVYDRDLGAALKVAERIDAGMVGVNRGIVSDPAAPFGGVKQSGIGREGARVGLEEFTETQYFSVAW